MFRWTESLTKLLKKGLKKVKSNGHLTQKELKQVLKNVLNKVRSLKKVLQQVNLLKNGF